LLCDRALLGAYARNQAAVSRRMVDEAGAEVFGANAARPARRWWALAAAATAAAAGAVAVVVWWAPGRDAALSLAGLARARSGELAAGEISRAPLDAVKPASGAAAGSAPQGSEARADAASDVAAARPTLLRTQEAAWRELAREWKVDLPPQGAACPALARQEHFCFARSMNLPLIRQLGRPGIVTLDARSSAPSFALLVGLTDRAATLRAAGVEQTVTLVALAARWQGDFATLWHAPQGYTGRTADLDRGPAFDWAASQLGRATGAASAHAASAPVRDRIRTFQVAQGLPVTGALSPMTFMQLNRAAGIDEPRLRVQP
ncbi:MAG TPA: peptidoglycan-binding protein, partial [Ramlibacter sp.]|nr:peptidoglycan-binding protein [Ramlibacter sp.]